MCYNEIIDGANAPERRPYSMTDEFDINQEDAAIETAFQNAGSDHDLPPQMNEGPQFRIGKKPIIIIVSIIAALLLSLIGLIAGLMIFSGRDNEDDRILENVYAAGIELSGMTVEEAINALHLATDSSFGEPMVIRIYDDTLVLSPEDTNASLDIEAVARAAYNYGRSGTHAENQQIRKNASKRSYTVPLLPYLNLDIATIQSTINDYCTATNSLYAEPIIVLEGERPVYDPDKTPKHQTLKITLGSPLIQLDANDLYEQVLDCYSVNELLLEYDAPEIIRPATVDVHELFSQYCTPAQDAVLDPTTYSITQEVYGYGFNIGTLQQKLDHARYGETVTIPLTFLEPHVFAQDLSENLFTEILSVYQNTDAFTDSKRNTNLQLSCDAINGYVIKPGETFSFLKVLGSVSAETGYTEAPICSVNGSAIGGGISQTASALYYCALHADLNIVEHHSHNYAVDFIELGFDAYVDGVSQDLRFLNNTGAPIRINASFSNRTISISLEGSTKLTYTVAIRTEITEKSQPITTYQMLLPNNKYGYKNGDVMVTGIEGYQVKISKEKTDIATGNTLYLDRLGIIEYKKRDEIIVQISTPTEEPPPTEPIEEAGFNQ